MKTPRVISGILVLFVCLLTSGSTSVFSASLFQPASPLSAISLQVDGVNDYIAIANAPAFNPSGAITLEAWVRPDTLGNCDTIFDKNWQTGYWLGLCNGQIRYYANGLGTQVTGTHAVTIGQWSHIAVTFNGTIRRYYINGMLDLEATTPSPLAVNADDIRLGLDYLGLNAFDGSLAEVRVWDIARSQHDIREDMVRLISEPRPGLVAVWHLEGNAEEVFGAHPGTLMNGATFSGPASRPVDHDPILIPRMAAPAALDGNCAPGEYENLWLPIWYEENVATGGVVWVTIGATETDLYVCMQALRWGSNAAQFAAVYLDPDHDGGIYAQSDDYRIRVAWPSATPTSEQGNGSGGYTGPGLANYATAADGFEFDWTAEYRLGRDALPAPEAIFGMQFMHHAVDGTGDDYGWPVDFDWNTPEAWLPFQINDADIPRPDSRNPEITARHFTGVEPIITDGDTVTLFTTASDDVDLAQIDIYLDGSVVRSCHLPGSNDIYVTSCTHAHTPSIGYHYYYAIAYDHRGRVGSSPLRAYFVNGNGAPPALTLSHTPVSPAINSPVTIRATATDPDGIREIRLTFDMLPYGHTCVYDGTSPTRTCSLVVRPTDGRLLIQYHASALDSESLRGETSTRYVLLGNTGTDTDNDGISNAHELLMCTSPSNPDSDRDGLNDGWEVLGISFPDGDYIDLPNEGAHPCYKDVFVQLDWNANTPFPQTDLTNAINLFRENGITLHVDGKEHPAVAPGMECGVPAEMAAAQTDASGNYYFHPKRNWTHHYLYARDCQGRSGSNPPMWVSIDMRNVDSPFYRFVHELGHLLGMGHGGRLGDQSQERVGSLIYYDGGWDNMNRKPNYLSTMNYRYSFNSNLCWDPATGWLQAEVNYTSSVLPALNEGNLDERSTSAFATALRARTCAAPDFFPVVVYTCSDPDESGTAYLMVSDGLVTVARVRAGSAWQTTGLPTHPAGIDWNCDGNIQASVTGSLNGDGGDFDLPGEACNGIDDNGNTVVDEGCPSTWTGGENMISRNDWGNIPAGRSCVIQTGGGQPPLEYRDLIGGPSCGGLVLRDTDGRPLIFPTQPSSGISHHTGHPDVFDLNALPNVEICDGVNNDGDGEMDEGCADADGDSVVDKLDNCPLTANPAQTDLDGDHVGDACQTPEITHFHIAQQTPTAITLAWDGPTEDLIGYNLYRMLEGESTPMLIATMTAPVVTRYVDLVALPDKYLYLLRPIKLNGVEGAAVILSSGTPTVLPLVVR